VNPVGALRLGGKAVGTSITRKYGYDRAIVIKEKNCFKEAVLKLINEEVRDLQIFLVLHKIKKHLEAKMTQSFDPVLSCKLDCINYLIEN
jgi:hypothetical protein